MDVKVILELNRFQERLTQQAMRVGKIVKENCPHPDEYIDINKRYYEGDHWESEPSSLLLPMMLLLI